MFTAGSSTRPPFWLKEHTADSKIARSRDGGTTWEQTRNGLPDHIRGNIEAMAMDVSNGTFSLFAGTTDGDVFHSTDEGDSWTKIAGGLPPISKAHHYLIIR